ncbi:MAG: hypothetical protein JO288_01305 [Hyphomicrobiales bacterium]|nr:hypothetical protein [Hyphomicrobiales bacterium]
MDRIKISSVTTAELALLADALLPGDGSFPAATAVGVHELLASRLEQLRGPLALAELAAAISAAGGPLGALDDASRTAAVAKIQRRYAALFDDVLRVAFLIYYESAIVQDAIRALGFNYHAHPLPGGYAAQIGQFDPVADTPTHGRGRYKRTEDVRRVSLDGLDLLGARGGG